MSDTSPLRALQALGRVELLSQVYGQAYLPPAVVAELAVARLGLPAFNARDHAFLIVRAPEDAAAVARLREELDPGESEALALAVELRAERVLIDESEGRRIAQRLGLSTIGVLGFLVQGKRQGRVERVAPLIDILTSKINFHVSAEVRQRVLRDAGE